MNKPVIALDFQTYEEVEQFLAKFSGEALSVKVGMELFYSNGPIIVEKIKQQNHEIFLDLKLHDIPNTVKSAMVGLAKLGVDMVNVHAAGGKNMMEAALEGLEIGSGNGKRPKIIAVTQLTSTSEASMQSEQLIKTSLLESVLHYSALTNQAGLNGVVCSALEAEAIKQQNGADFLRVTPGIRLASDAADDQIRVVTPEKARLIGSTDIVVGRSITRANDPVVAYNQVLKEWNV
ncbi:orotidine-5'-phosphate decarboxylase [Listeria monocytogenes]|uniref:orotidine-5'-phosphate decarboxylase n=1 Tax=Listeria monocytogenes TaxID=1639 RepID=UPI0010B545C2|nr:orotidine-5'-phosphate decarboxylase [Listeria monocytogenes]EAC8324857.1 orotidine-5'-phosphate decarboxylase [Listeria monocytogenes]EAC8327998.1 orotidine-5'-phosphate decarboxylase [Listeria monocytogenes]EAC8634984.1 orotidine-5'-phosphate decarboxylase [Listeria monocytogenes]ECB9819934.1 orotidine-5'-phosphate decarboxylase [Listeria monocytogenes]